MNNITTNFGSSSNFGKPLDEDIQVYQNQLGQIEDGLNKAADEKASGTNAIQTGINDKYRENTNTYKDEIDSIKKNYEKSASANKKQAEDLVKQREAAAGMEANIAGANANRGGKLSVAQVTSLNTDITNKFADSVNQAKSDLINFNLALDDKIVNLGFSVIDKKKLLDEFSKTLDQEDAAPLLDAIATKAQNKTEFLTDIKETIKTINQKKIDESLNRGLREDRLIDEENAFNAMSTTERTNYVQDKFGSTWNVLTAGQRNELINKAANGKISISEMNALIENYKDQSEQQKIIQQQSIASDPTLAPDALLETGMKMEGPQTFTTGTTTDKNVTGSSTSAVQNGQLKNTNDLLLNVKSKYPDAYISGNSIFGTKNGELHQWTLVNGYAVDQGASVPSKTSTTNKASTTSTTSGYKVGSNTYKSKDAYEQSQQYLKTNKDKLEKLKSTDKAAYKKVEAAFKAKYFQ